MNSEQLGVRRAEGAEETEEAEEEKIFASPASSATSASPALKIISLPPSLTPTPAQSEFQSQTQNLPPE